MSSVTKDILYARSVLFSDSGCHSCHIFAHMRSGGGAKVFANFHPVKIVTKCPYISYPVNFRDDASLCAEPGGGERDV
jgi:hypothetical protein